MRLLVAGFGSVLRGDDGFGVAVVHALMESGVPEAVRLIDAGIAGVRVVQELMTGYDAMIIIDAVARDGDPGAIYLLEPEVPDPQSISPSTLRSLTADMHLTQPSRVLLHAKALHVLPRRIWLIGCEPACTDEYMLGLTPAVRDAVPAALRRVRALIDQTLASGAA